MVMTSQLLIEYTTPNYVSYTNIGFKSDVYKRLQGVRVHRKELCILNGAILS